MNMILDRVTPLVKDLKLSIIYCSAYERFDLEKRAQRNSLRHSSRGFGHVIYQILISARDMKLVLLSKKPSKSFPV